MNHESFTRDIKTYTPAPAPFADQAENNKLAPLYKKILNNLNAFDFLKNPYVYNDTTINFDDLLENISAAILLELNKILPSPNYQIYMTYRVKSLNSFREKINDYVNRSICGKIDSKTGEIKELPIFNTSQVMKDILDLVGMRIIVTKIPEGIPYSSLLSSLSESELKTIKKLANERYELKKKLTNYYNPFIGKILDGECTNRQGSRQQSDTDSSSDL